MPSYDLALTIFAPDGKLFQVEYTFEAATMEHATVAVKGQDGVVLACETKHTAPP